MEHSEGYFRLAQIIEHSFIVFYEAKECPAIEPTNATLSTTDTTYGVIVHYKCHNGSQMRDGRSSKNLTCSVDATRSSTVTPCSRKLSVQHWKKNIQ